MSRRIPGPLSTGSRTVTDNDAAPRASRRPSLLLWIVLSIAFVSIVVVCVVRAYLNALPASPDHDLPHVENGHTAMAGISGRPYYFVIYHGMKGGPDGIYTVVGNIRVSRENGLETLDFTTQSGKSVHLVPAPDQSYFFTEEAQGYSPDQTGIVVD